MRGFRLFPTEKDRFAPLLSLTRAVAAQLLETGDRSLDKITCLGSCFATAGNRASLRLKETGRQGTEEEGRRKTRDGGWSLDKGTRTRLLVLGSCFATAGDGRRTS